MLLHLETFCSIILFSVVKPDLSDEYTSSRAKWAKRGQKMWVRLGLSQFLWWWLWDGRGVFISNMLNMFQPVCWKFPLCCGLFCRIGSRISSGERSWSLSANGAADACRLWGSARSPTAETHFYEPKRTFELNLQISWICLKQWWESSLT